MADALNAPPVPANVAVLARPTLPKSGNLDARAVGQVIAHYLPEGAIVADEAITSGFPCFSHTATAAPHDYLNLPGGAIGGWYRSVPERQSHVKIARLYVWRVMAAPCTLSKRSGPKHASGST